MTCIRKKLAAVGVVYAFEDLPHYIRVVSG